MIERIYQDEQRVTVISADIHDARELELVGQCGTVRSFSLDTGLYIVSFDNGRIRPFYGQELESSEGQMNMKDEAKRGRTVRIDELGYFADGQRLESGMVIRRYDEIDGNWYQGTVGQISSYHHETGERKTGLALIVDGYAPSPMRSGDSIEIVNSPMKDEAKRDTAPFGKSRRIIRNIRIQERNNPPSLVFDTDVVYASDNLPEWFAPLQPIVEDETFTNMLINLGDKVHYLISIAYAS